MFVHRKCAFDCWIGSQPFYALSWSAAHVFILSSWHHFFMNQCVQSIDVLEKVMHIAIKLFVSQFGIAADHLKHISSL